jgi:quinol monooxygenase YgiN
MFDKIGVKCRTFRDPNNNNSTGVIAEITDMAAFENFMASDEVKKAMAEDGLKVESLRMLVEFTP